MKSHQKQWLLMLGTSILLVSSGCKKSENDKAAPAASTTVAASDAPLTLERYEALILALSTCKTANNENYYYGDIDASCPAYKEFNTARLKKDAMKNIAGKTGPLARKLLTNPAPAVRVQAAKMMESLLGTSKEDVDAIVNLAKTEKDISVLKALLHTVANNGKNPEVASMLLMLAAHENPQVRATAAVSVSSSWNKGMPGGVEKLIQLIEKDPDAKVKQAACKYAGELGDGRLIPIYTKYTTPRTDPNLAAECFQGLLKMWASWPLFGNADGKAYNLTLKVLNQKPRTDKMPPWIAIGTFKNMGKAEGSGFEKWKTQAPWYNTKVLKQTMLDLAGDKAMNWLGRSAAVEAAVALGATQVELTTLKTKIGPSDTQVIQKIDKEMAEAK